MAPPTAPAASSARLPDTDSHSSLRLGSATATEPQSITAGRRPARSPSDEGDRSLSGPPAERGAGRPALDPARSGNLVPSIALRPGRGTPGRRHGRGGVTQKRIEDVVETTTRVGEGSEDSRVPGDGKIVPHQVTERDRVVGDGY